MGDQRLRRRDRIRQQTDFDRVYQSNAYAADEVLVIKACARPGAETGPDNTGMRPVDKGMRPTDTATRPDDLGTRLGLSVSRKYGNAVVRNRWKRLIREVFRKTRAELPPGLDLVVRPRRGADPDYQRIRRSLPSLVRRLARRVGR